MDSTKIMEGHDMAELTKEQIAAKLDAAGIEYDGRLGADKLAELLPKEDSKADEKTVEMRLRRDWWPAEGVRKRKGEIVTVTVEKAMDGMESGFLERVKA